MTGLKIVSMIALVLTFIPSLLFVGGTIDQPTVNLIALVATVVWFVVTPFWMGRATCHVADHDPLI